jgi:hypothetical protein
VIVLGIAAVIIALGCAAACIIRLAFATSPIAFHPGVWRERLETGREGPVETAIAREPAATWERELLAALKTPDDEMRAGLVNEQLRELDFRLARWERVPRVCASISSSAGFLLGSLVLRFGLSAIGNASEEGQGDAINAVVLQAINVAAFGVAGATFAIATQYRARKAARAFQQEADALVEILEKRK